MKKPAKKAKRTRAVTSAGPTLRIDTKKVEIVHELETLEALLASPPQAVDKWLLVPVPEPRFAGPANRKKFLDAITHARVKLIYERFGDLYAQARELSDAGGVLRVETVHLRSWVRVDKGRVFVDGKMEDEA